MRLVDDSDDYEGQDPGRQGIHMDLSPAVINDLTELGAALDDVDTADIAFVLGAFAADLTESLAGTIPAYLGMRIAARVGGVRVVISTLTEETTSEVGGSLLLTLLPTGAATTGTLTFYSRGTGAFADLADSARWIFNLDRRPVQDAASCVA